MKKTLLGLSFLVYSVSFVNAQIINTYAGRGTAGYSGDGGPATAAEMTNPTGVATDAAGNVYIADFSNSCIRMVNTSGVITTVVGYGVGGFSGDGGQATNAQVNEPTGVRLDAVGNIYIADYANQRVRKVDTNGIITTIAGNGAFGYSGDGGPATSAELYFPWEVSVDAIGNVYIADHGNNRVRMVNTNGTISTIAGNGIAYYFGDGGLATAAELNQPEDMMMDGFGNLYIADYNNNRIRKVNSSGIISTFAGNGASGYGGDGGQATAAIMDQPSGVLVSGKNVYIADYQNNRIRMVDSTGIITTIAGDGQGGYNGDGGPATAAELYTPYEVAVSGNSLYIADELNKRIRVVNGIPLGINAVQANNPSVLFYPNPNNGMFNLSIESSVVSIKSAVIEINNVLGEKVYSDALPPTCDRTSIQIDLKTHSPGIYFYRISTETGIIAKGKFVIE